MDAPALRSAVADFLASFTHEVLYQRSLYASDIFERRRLYDISVRRSRHPMLNNYIDGAVDAVTDALIAGTVRRFAVLVLDQNGLVVERFVAALAVRPEILASVEPEDVEAALRSCLLKLQFLETSLEPLPAGCTFEVIAYATDRAALPIASWVDADPGRAGGAWLGAYSDDSVSGGEGSSSDGGGGGGGRGGASPGASPTAGKGGPRRGGFGGPSILPLKSASAGGGALSLQVYVEGGDGGGLASRLGSPTAGGLA